jgi:hypothetical protein
MSFLQVELFIFNTDLIKNQIVAFFSSIKFLLQYIEYMNLLKLY